MSAKQRFLADMVGKLTKSLGDCAVIDGPGADDVTVSVLHDERTASFPVYAYELNSTLGQFFDTLSKRYERAIGEIAMTRRFAPTETKPAQVQKAIKVEGSPKTVTVNGKKT